MSRTSTGTKKKAKRKGTHTFMIRHFDDYHEIRSKTHRYIELGCWPVKNEDYGYNRYFGLFFKGRKPSATRVLAALKRKVDLDTPMHYATHYRTGERIGIDEATLKEEVYEVMKLTHDGPDED